MATIAILNSGQNRASALLKTGGSNLAGSNFSLLFSSYPDIELEIDPETLEPITDDVEAFEMFREGLGRDGKGYTGYERAHLICNPRSGLNYEALINDPGDGVVTRESLVGRPSRIDSGPVAPLEISHSVFLCEAHQSLTGNPSFQDNLLYTLLSVEESS